MDTLTVLAAWTGAITGVGGLVVQYVLHRRSGVVVRLHVAPRYEDESGRLKGVVFEFINRGRQDVQLEHAGAADVRVARYWRRTVLMTSPLRARKWLTRTGFVPRRVQGVASVVPSSRGPTLKAGTTVKFEARITENAKAERLVDTLDHVYPYARLGNGKLLRGRRLPTQL